MRDRVRPEDCRWYPTHNRMALRGWFRTVIRCTGCDLRETRGLRHSAQRVQAEINAETIKRIDRLAPPPPVPVSESEGGQR